MTGQKLDNRTKRLTTKIHVHKQLSCIAFSNFCSAAHSRAIQSGVDPDLQLGGCQIM